MTVTSRTAAVLRRDLPARVLGAGLLLAALDPARFSDPPAAGWILSLAAVAGGGWAGPPIRERPALTDHRLARRISRYRNTLLPSVSVLLAATAAPPTWLMAADVVLLLTYLSMLDLFLVAPGTSRRLGAHTVAAWVAAAVVLAAARMPVSGSWWGRIVAAGAVLLVSASMYAALRLRRPATYRWTSSDASAASGTAATGPAARTASGGARF